MRRFCASWVKPRVLSTTITEADGTASLDLAFEVAGHFGLKPKTAQSIAAEVREAVAGWRRVAKSVGLSANEIDRMEIRLSSKHKKIMSTLYGSLRLRQFRVGFLVPPTNLDVVRNVMQLCSCLWGGRYNPIIPVDENLPDAWKD